MQSFRRLYYLILNKGKFQSHSFIKYLESGNGLLEKTLISCVNLNDSISLRHAVCVIQRASLSPLFCIKILNILSFWKTSVYQELIKTVFMFSYWACCVLECDHKKTMRNYFYMNFMTIWNLLSHPRREMMIIFKCCLKSP